MAEVLCNLIGGGKIPKADLDALQAKYDIALAPVVFNQEIYPQSSDTTTSSYYSPALQRINERNIAVFARIQIFVSGNRPGNFELILQGSSDNSNWTDIKTIGYLAYNATNNAYSSRYFTATDNSYSYYRLKLTGQKAYCTAFIHNA